MSRLGGEGSSRLADKFTRDGQRFARARQRRFNSRFEQNRFEENSLENRTDPPDFEGSTRLADVPLSQFQLRNLFREQQTERVEESRESFADTLDLDDAFIRPVQLDDRGEEIGFVPNKRGRSTLAERFAEQRPFVEPSDALVDANPREGVLTRTDPNQLDEIAERAERDFASEADFIRTSDLEADVGPGGVEDVRTRRSRRDDIGERVAANLAADDPFAEPGDFGVNIGPRGVESANFTPAGERRRATRQFTDSLDVFEPGDLDPQTDIRETNDGFALSRGPAREAAAADIDRQLPNLDIGPGDIELEETSSGFEATFEREIRR